MCTVSLPTPAKHLAVDPAREVAIQMSQSSNIYSLSTRRRSTFAAAPPARRPRPYWRARRRPPIDRASEADVRWVDNRHKKGFETKIFTNIL